MLQKKVKGKVMKILNRAKSIYSDEYLISEDIKFELGLMYLRINGKWKECDKDTRSINFEDMLDNQGNKIFASLREDGKGGDRLLEESRLMCNLKIDNSSFREFTAIHTINGNRFVNEKILSDVGNYKDKHFKGFDILIYDFFMMKKRNIKVIGIQE